MRKTGLWIVACVFMGAFVFGVSLMSADYPTEVKLKAKLGTVTFPHKKHVEELKLECTTCHHTLKEGEKPVKCTTCHGVKEDAPKVMKAFHNRCKTCHKEKNEKEGKKAPTGCKECHVKE